MLLTEMHRIVTSILVACEDKQEDLTVRFCAGFAAGVTTPRHVWPSSATQLASAPDLEFDGGHQGNNRSEAQSDSKHQKHSKIQ